MKVSEQLKAATLSLDEKLAGTFLSGAREEDALLCFLFHGLFESGAESRSGVLDPQQGVTVEMFRALVRHFQEHGYNFVSPEQILLGLKPGGKYVLLTFDDGYFSNHRALPVMEECNVPALFFISSDHVQEGKAFWWDVAFREGRKHGCTEEEICRTVAGYKRRKTEEVESDLRKKFGKDTLRPVGDLDRPFTPGELRAFASHRLVSLGNHTKNHAILTNYSPAEVREQIQGGQDVLEQMTGQIPKMISYPNGNCSPEIQQAARDAGLKLGVGVQGGKNRLPLNCGALDAMILKRFILWGNRGIEAQCRAACSDLSISRLLSGFAARTTTRPSKCSWRERRRENLLQAELAEKR